MEILPSIRFNPNPVFQNCVIDFCRPFEIKDKNQRKGKFSRICVELFGYESSSFGLYNWKFESFIATLKRFFFVKKKKKSTVMIDNGSTNYLPL